MIRLAFVCFVILLPSVAGAQNMQPGKLSAASRIAVDRLDPLDSFGEAVARIGDIDGDGVPDVAVGAPRDDDGGVNRGAVWLLTLRQDATVKSHWKISSTAGGFAGLLDDFDFFGSAVAAVGDLDDDGVGDLAVGAPRDDDGANTPNANRGAVWILFMTADGTVKRQRKISSVEGGYPMALDDQDLFGASLAYLGPVEGGGAVLAVGTPGDGGNGRGAVRILHVDAGGDVTAHVRITEGEGGFTGTLREFDSFGGGVAALGDVNGDGTHDLAVGAFRDSEGPHDDGAVWVLFLQPDGTVKGHHRIASGADGFLESADGGARFGYSVAGLGDIDRDGTPDIAVGAPSADVLNRGQTWVINLRPDGTIKSRFRIANRTGGIVLDDDDRFGTSVAGISDLDGDGTPDLIVGAPSGDAAGDPHDRGAAWVLRLGPDGSVQQSQMISNRSTGFTSALEDNDWFGAAVADIGDIDGDGTSDLAVGAPRDDDGGIDRGAVWLLMPLPDGRLKTLRKISATEGGFTGPLNDFDYFGSAVTDVGDLDGDGMGEIAVGASRDDDGTSTPNANPGAVWILSLRPDGSVKHQRKISGIDDGLAGEIDAQDLFGRSVASIGDLNGDGVPDLAVGLPGDNFSRGAVMLLMLKRDGSVETHRKIGGGAGGLSGPITELDFFGTAVTRLGDLDGDGVTELAVGAPGNDGQIDSADFHEGAVWILFLGQDGSVKSSRKIHASKGSSAHGGRFGAALASLDDLDGDGIPELAVGEPASGERTGTVSVLFLRSDGTVKDRQRLPSVDGTMNGLLDRDDQFGTAIAKLHQNRSVLVGAPRDDDGDTAVDRGAVWLLYDIPFPPPKIEIAGAAAGQPTVGSDIPVSARIVAVSGVADVTANFRRGGDLEFFRATMREREPEVYEFIIPAFAADPRGIEYFVSATNADGVQTRAPAFGVASIPLFAPEGLASPLVNGSAADAYRLISVPLHLEDRDPRALLEDDLGPYARSRWRFFGQAGENGELSELGTGDLTVEPGSAFWLLVRDDGQTLTTGSGTSVRTDRPFERVLRPGWNLVGSPFTFPISVSQMHLRSGRPVDIRTYAGSWAEVTGSIQPLVGYAVFNNQGVVDTLVIDPQSAADVDETAEVGPSDAWSIRITAQSDRARDDDNTAAVSPHASAGWDVDDRAEPPPVGDYVSVSFPRADDDQRTAPLNRDVRPMPGKTERWTIRVAARQLSRVQLRFDRIDEVPPEYGVWLLDGELKRSIDLREQAGYTVMAGEGAEARLLTLAVDIDGSHNAAAELPRHSGITSFYPNPFGGAATIQYALKEQAKVRVDVVDVLGRRVATLTTQSAEPGHHAVVWDGRTDANQPLAPGVYFVRLEANGFFDVRQIVRAK